MQTAQPTTAARLLDNTPLVVLFLLLFDSLHLVFARLLLPYMSPFTSSLYVLGVAAVEIAIFMALRRQINLSVLRQHLLFFSAIGFLVAAATVLSYTSVRYVDPGTASLLSRSTTIFSLGFGFLWLRDRFGWRSWLGTLIAIAGIIIISFQPVDVLRLGSLFVLGSSFVYALHVAITKRYGDEIEFANFFLFRVALTTAFLIIFALGAGELKLPPTAAWPYLILAATVDVTLSRTLYYLMLRRITLSVHAIILTVSPVLTILWSILLFGEQPTLRGLIGGTAVVIGVLIVTLRRQARQA